VNAEAAASSLFPPQSPVTRSDCPLRSDSSRSVDAGQDALPDGDVRWKQESPGSRPWLGMSVLMRATTEPFGSTTLRRQRHRIYPAAVSIDDVVSAEGGDQPGKRAWWLHMPDRRGQNDIPHYCHIRSISTAASNEYERFPYSQTTPIYRRRPATSSQENHGVSQSRS